MRFALLSLLLIACHRQPRVMAPDPERGAPPGPERGQTTTPPTTPTAGRPSDALDESARQPWSRTDPAHNVWRDGRWVSKTAGKVWVNAHPVWTPTGWATDAGGWLAIPRPDARYEQGSYECRDGEHKWIPGAWYPDDKPREERREPPAIFMRERPANGRLDLSINLPGVLQNLELVDGSLVWRASGATWTMRADGGGCIARIEDGLHGKPEVKAAFTVAGGRLVAVTRTAVVRYAADPSGSVDRSTVGPLPGDPVLAVSDGASLYVHAFATDTVMRIPLGGGAAAPIGELPKRAGEQGVAMAVQGGTLYVASYATGDVLAFPTAGGAPRPIARGLPNPRAIAVDGSALYVLCQRPKRGGSELEGQLRRIELASGASRVLASNLFNGGHLALDGPWIYVPSQSTQFGDDVAHDGKLLRVARDGSRPPQPLIEGMANLGPILTDGHAVYAQVLDRHGKTRVIRLDK